MVTLRKIRSLWTEVKRVVEGEVKVTTCCCAGPGATPRECAATYDPPHKTPCRCFCHSAKHERSTWERQTSAYLRSQLGMEDPR